MQTMTLSEIEQLRVECRNMVAKQSMVSGAIAIVPIPGLDVGADVAIMSRMIDQINQKFGLTPAQIEQLNPLMKQRVFVIVSSLSSSLIGKYISLKNCCCWRSSVLGCDWLVNKPPNLCRF
ncbi:DUF697 domain-containing protein [Deefgea sp. CFH1-16]|uniref:DUF697 domain-containing protein n=1 Tax=Deefgea sp. CFH1-16 TaxID=2675457 RepID=UPI0015F6220F|nr:DUF697 domain-containing protein [Deefgea sp. CFH1-16]MBM5575213.1 DUF697 domain-containing protein [Deefgea sp. CFH1-16]